MNTIIKPCKISGIIRAPSSKSYSQRYILYSAFSGKEIELKGISFSDDEIIAIKIAEKCNARIEYDRKNIVVIPDFKCPETIYAGESGTSYRLSIGLLAGRKCITSITGEASLSKRPVDTLINALTHTGIKFTKNNLNFFDIDAINSINMPVKIDGSVSSQFVSSLLYYYSFFENSEFSAENTVSKNYINITIQCLNDFDVSVTENNGKYSLIKKSYNVKSINLEGDYSSASYFMVLGLFTGKITIQNLQKNSFQPDRSIVDIIMESAGSIKIFEDYITVYPSGNIKKIVLDASISPDLAPIIAVIGIFSENGVDIYNYNRLSMKESDRYNGIISMCRSFGASISINKNYIHINKGTVKKPISINFDDHRMIMSSIVAALIAGSETEFTSIEKINKSYPEFLNDLQRIGCDINISGESLSI